MIADLNPGVSLLIDKGLELMEIPRKIVFGPMAIKEVNEVCSEFSPDGKVFVLSGGKHTTAIADDKVIPVLEEGGLNVKSASLGSQLASLHSVLNILKKVKKHKSSLLLAVGGGKVIDVGKAVSSILGIPYISIPTSAANDGIASPEISYLLKIEITKELAPQKFKARAPIAIIADTKIISRAPRVTLIAGCGDLLAKFVAVKDWELAYKLRGEPYSEYAASLALLSAQLIVKRAKYIKEGLEESARIVVKALIGSGVAMSIAGSSRPASGSEHLFSHALDVLSKKYGFKAAPHGLQVGLGAIMMMWLHGGDWERIRNTLKLLGAPTNAYELGIEPKYIIEALTIAHKIRPDRYTILGSAGLTAEAAERLAKETEVI